MVCRPQVDVCYLNTPEKKNLATRLESIKRTIERDLTRNHGMNFSLIFMKTAKIMEEMTARRILMFLDQQMKALDAEDDRQNLVASIYDQVVPAYEIPIFRCLPCFTKLWW